MIHLVFECPIEHETFQKIMIIFIISAKNSEKSKRPVTKSASIDQKDESSKTPSRKTPAQVKAESAARKAKVFRIFT